MTVRVERDSIGPVEVPADRLWGAQTQRALDNFPYPGHPMPRAVVRALARIKAAAARANQELGALDPRLVEAIVQAAGEVARGELDEHFPLPVWQTGSGTQSNMNVNEVVANRAIQLLGGELGSRSPVHPNDHVNRSQSSNDVFPTAMHLAVLDRAHAALLPALDGLLAELAARARDFEPIVTLGRTHLQDAVPLPLAEEFRAFIAQISRGRQALEQALEGCLALPLGGTAVGTGLGAAKGFRERAIELLALDTGLALVPAESPFAGLAGHEDMVLVSNALAALATSLIKTANDIRFLASGPRAGIGELKLPANEPGSSIMPGKVNPTQCEALVQVSTQVLGNAQTVLLANAQGHFQLNVMKPCIVRNVLESIELLAAGCGAFTRLALAGLQADEARIREHLESSLMLVTALSPKLGYDTAAAVAHKAHAEGATLRETALAMGLLTAEEFDELVDPQAMARPQG